MYSLNLEGINESDHSSGEEDLDENSELRHTFKESKEVIQDKGRAKYLLSICANVRLN